MRCGTSNPDEAKNCQQCGMPLVDIPPAQPHKQQQSNIPSTDGTPAAATGVSTMQRKLPMTALIAIIAASIAMAVCAATFITYKMELWGPQTVPSITASNAEDAVNQLASKGFVVKKKQQYNAIRKGGYIGMTGAKTGERITRGSQITVLESLGPGVPQGTVGSTAKQAEAKLKPMGVKITEHEVVSEHPGKVSVSAPADGQPVTDSDEGIHLGIGVEGDGIPVEIAGMDKQQAENELFGKGYSVTLEPRFSSKQYFGKIVGANPGIGVKTDATDITLYYGVDASGRYDVLTGTKGQFDTGFKDIARTDRLAGRYCTEDGDCITMSEDASQASDTTYYVSGEFNQADSLNLCGVIQGPGVCTPTNQADAEIAQASSLNNSLISGDTGAFELYKGLGSAYCGNDLSPITPGYVYCDNGHLANGDGSQQQSGETFKATDFFVYMPVNANLSALESNGYFTNKSSYQPDKNRPYVIKRDNSDYKPIPVDNNATGPRYDPYVPSSGSKPVQFKEAPNKHNVYYLVETPIDWNQINGTDTTNAGNDNSTNDSASEAKPSESFNQFAGSYLFSSGSGGWATTLTVSNDGSFTGEFHDDDLGITGPGYPNGSKSEAKFSGRFASISQNADGSYALQCDSNSFAVEGTKGSTHIEDGMQITITDAYGMEPCGLFTAYPKGYDSSKLSNDVKSWNAGSYDFTANSSLSINILVNNNQQESFYQQQ
ncbi:PASTA domain-containing protein [Bifidobacterium imperatoris]|nr:PASTA domain-containing protein [Bifidobacterium imperatoris]